MSPWPCSGEPTVLLAIRGSQRQRKKKKQTPISKFAGFRNRCRNFWLAIFWLGNLLKKSTNQANQLHQLRNKWCRNKKTNGIRQYLYTYISNPPPRPHVSTKQNLKTLPQLQQQLNGWLLTTTAVPFVVSSCVRPLRSAWAELPPESPENDQWVQDWKTFQKERPSK